MDRNTTASRRGVTLTELLVVLVIISILSTIAVPVYLSKSQNAKKAAALADCRELAEAEEACVVAHGFYVPLQVLNDLPWTSSQSISTSDGSLSDTIVDDANKASRKAIDPNLTISQLIQSPQLTNSATVGDQRVVRMVNYWEGPFINFHRFAQLTGTISSSGTGSDIARINMYPPREHPDNYPIDPWGTPYLFYLPNARVQPYNGTISSGDNRFMRYAIVSAGPDGIFDDSQLSTGGTITTGSTSSDDIIYTFGTIKNESIF